ncbi:MAG TPA: SIR2 family protein [Candidatus Methylomirabilis sp.]|nr:SIR2 family protein [Candidatus Methylomirabilis sp.]
MPVNLETFYGHFGKALEEGYAALFAGEGLSRPSGFVDWKELLRDIAIELDLDADRESDIEEFTKDAKITENHRLITVLPIRTVWTTNYDQLLEQAYRDTRKRPDVKIKQDDLAVTIPGTDVTIYKMHGDFSQPRNAVLTKEDYETYNEHRALFSEKLKGDLIEKTFLFLGFSFTDPNIDSILGRIRALLGQNRREHYCIMSRPRNPKGGGRAKAQFKHEKTKLDLRIADLKRYGIRALLVEDYAEVTAILKELSRRSHRKDFFVSGSASDFSPMGRERVEKLARDIGQGIIRKGHNLVSGFGLGIGGVVTLGAMEELDTDEKSKFGDRTTLRPFPQEPPRGMTRETFWTRYREDMIANAGFAVFLCGNKLDPGTGKTVIASGVMKEFEITKRLNKYPIPVGATGHAARRIWEEVNGSLDRFFPNGGVKGHFQTLSDTRSTNEEMVGAIFAIAKRVVSN